MKKELQNTILLILQLYGEVSITVTVFLTKRRKPSEVKARGLTGRSSREGV